MISELRISHLGVIAEARRRTRHRLHRRHR